MTLQVNVAEAKSKLSELMARAERGERVELCRNGKPTIVLTPYWEARQSMKPFHRLLGALAHLGPLSDEENAYLLEPDPAWAEAAERDDDDDLWKA